VHRCDVEIVGKAATTSAAPTEAGNGDAVPPIYRAPLPAPQPRARKEIIAPGEPTPRRINHGLILAIARAKRWMQGLCDGRYQDTAEIARRFKLNEVLFADVKNTGVTEMIMPSSTTGNSGRPAVILSRYSRALARRGA